MVIINVIEVSLAFRGGDDKMFSDGWLRPRKQGSGGVSKSINGPSFVLFIESFIETIEFENSEIRNTRVLFFRIID